MTQRIDEVVAQRTFEAVAARLAPCGYDYDARLGDGAELLAFRKPLGADVQAIVQFQRRGNEWTINLLRVKSAEVAAHFYGGYAGALGARLGHVLWFVASVRDSGQPDRWWTPDELADAVNLLIDFGLPWLEDEHAPRPWDMPVQRWAEFVETVFDIAGPELQALDYRAATQTLAGQFPYPYFVKSLLNGQFALIEFQPIYSVDPARFTFDVRLQRKPTDNPLDFDGTYGEWRAASLGQLVWRARWSGDEAGSVAAVKSLLWQYADRAELAGQLRAVLTQVKTIAQPWLETDGDLRGDDAADTI